MWRERVNGLTRAKLNVSRGNAGFPICLRIGTFVCQPPASDPLTDNQPLYPQFLKTIVWCCRFVPEPCTVIFRLILLTCLVIFQTFAYKFRIFLAWLDVECTIVDYCFHSNWLTAVHLNTCCIELLRVRTSQISKTGLLDQYWNMGTELIDVKGTFKNV